MLSRYYPNTTESDITSSFFYRSHHLLPKRIQLIQHGLIPEWVWELAGQLYPYGSKSPRQISKTSKYARRVKRCFKAFRRMLHKSNKVPLNKEERSQKLRQVLPLNIDLAELRCYSEVLCEASREPFTASTSRYFSKKRPISTPAPDIVYGYRRTAFWGDPDVGTCNEPGVMFPYLIVEFQQMGGNMYQAANKCLGGSAVSLRLTENVVGYRHLVFSVSTNGQVADVYVMWSDAISKQSTTGGRSPRKHVMFHLDSFILAKFEEFERFWHILYNIHCWGLGRRLASLRGKIGDVISAMERSKNAKPGVHVHG
ncbi:hypothetical protein F5B19DRAFT_447224 [Rostrohypoxylon terebratum]|nr:hypothetical protein F5B19DRAFT_447224 [Rostrohypoxylon terebratum]